MSRFPTAAHPVFVGQVLARAPRGSPQDQGQRIHRPRQPLPGCHPGRGRRRGRQNRHLPGRTIRRIAKRRGKKRAMVAVGRSDPGHRLAPARGNDARFTDLGADHFTKHRRPGWPRSATTSASSKPSATPSRKTVNSCPPKSQLLRIAPSLLARRRVPRNPELRIKRGCRGTLDSLTADRRTIFFSLPFAMSLACFTAIKRFLTDSSGRALKMPECDSPVQWAGAGSRSVGGCADARVQ